MGGYANGQAPLDMFVKVGHEQYLWPGTARRWEWMVAEGKRRHGVTLYITPGWNGYRPYDEQVRARAAYGNMAAVPGTSSHGGTWAGPATGWATVPTGAIDVGNWSSIGWGNFDRLARDAGFITDAVSPQELWHIIDLNPWVIPAGLEPEEKPDFIKHRGTDPKMEFVVKAPNGTVVHICPGAKYDFGSAKEYNTARDQFNTIRKSKGSNVMPLPRLDKVRPVGWDTFEFICKYCGVDPN